MTIDRRAARTRAALFDALTALMRHRPYSAIAVRDIVAAANAGRSTFYAHFRSKEELLAASLRRLRPLLAEGRATQMRRPRENGCEGTLALFRHVDAHRDLLRIVDGTPAMAIIVASLERELAGFLSPFAKRGPDHPPRDLVLRFITSAFVTTMMWWFERGPNRSPEEMDTMFHRLVGRGIPAGFFEERSAAGRAA
ncbi:MAG: TetR/AcrR family transcriptional regulator [Rhizobiaceae bacterium]